MSQIARLAIAILLLASHCLHSEATQSYNIVNRRHANRDGRRRLMGSGKGGKRSGKGGKGSSSDTSSSEITPSPSTTAPSTATPTASPSTPVPTGSTTSSSKSKSSRSKKSKSKKSSSKSSDDTPFPTTSVFPTSSPYPTITAFPTFSPTTTFSPTGTSKSRSKSKKGAKSSKRSKREDSTTVLPIEFSLCYTIPGLSNAPTETQLLELLDGTSDFYSDYLNSLYGDGFDELNLIITEVEILPGGGISFCAEYQGTVIFVGQSAPSPEEILDDLQGADFDEYLEEVVKPIDGFEAATEVLFLSPGATLAPTFSSAPSPSQTAAPISVTPAPTAAPVSGTRAPTTAPTNAPTAAPITGTRSPTLAPTAAPVGGTAAPTVVPTVGPTASPITGTAAPTLAPTASPTASPIAGSAAPTLAPTSSPTASPIAGTAAPTVAPTPVKTASPTPGPTASPTPPTNTPRYNTELDLTNVGAQYQSAFTSAATRWDTVITGDVEDVTLTAADKSQSACKNLPNTIDDIHICATVQPGDGVGGVLGSAAPEAVRLSGPNVLLTTIGVMTFDSFDIDNLIAKGEFEKVILHEMGHVYGLGTIWKSAGLTPSFNAPCPYKTDSKATAEWQALSGCTSTVPVEQDGAAGTVCGHWDEDCFQSELMTGFSSGGMELSRVTVAGLEDIGYTVNYAVADTYTSSMLNSNCRCNNLSESEHQIMSLQDSPSPIHDSEVMRLDDLDFTKHAQRPERPLRKNGTRNLTQRKNRHLSDEGRARAILYGKELLRNKKALESLEDPSSSLKFIGDMFVSVLYEEEGDVFGVEVWGDDY